uniref:Endo/exonuclease/phosphatase domain-containing protein n=1 Tax=Schistocephalus solidus TaxID=70667 RepID=A0A183SJA6_SCHSO
LVHYKVNLAALSETRFSEQGQLEEVGAGFTFFWSCRPKVERRDAGVTFAIRNDIVVCLPCLPQGIHDRLDKATWMHPRSRRWQLLDYVLVRRRDRQDVLVPKAIRDANVWTDHRLVISKMRLQLQPQRRPQGKWLPGKLNTLLLNLPAHCFDFSNQITEKLEDLHAPDDNATAMPMLGRITASSYLR